VKLENHLQEIGAVYQLGETEDSKNLVSSLSIFSKQIFIVCYLILCNQIYCIYFTK